MRVSTLLMKEGSELRRSADDLRRKDAKLLFRKPEKNMLKQ